jgi:hypothetical protein
VARHALLFAGYVIRPARPEYEDDAFRGRSDYDSRDYLPHVMLGGWICCLRQVARRRGRSHSIASPPFGDLEEENALVGYAVYGSAPYRRRCALSGI